MIPFPDKKYNIIYADPPWAYKRKADTIIQGGAIRHYKTMSEEDIQNLPIHQIADDNCALLMWVTFPKLIEQLPIMKAWGFKYKTIAFDWVKTNPKNCFPFFGVGYYAKSNAEVCLLGIKGKMKPVSNKISSIVEDFEPEQIISPREEHSKKPDIVRDRIVELFGDLPRIELFARQRAAGWDAWGNQTPLKYSYL